MLTGFLTPLFSPLFWIAAPVAAYSGFATYSLALATETLETTGGCSILVDFQFVSDIINCCQNADGVYHLTYSCPVLGLPLLLMPTPVWSPPLGPCS